MNISISELRLKNDDQLAPTAQALFDIINPLVPSLADYGITSAIMTSWRQDINNYLDVLASAKQVLFVS